MEPVDDGDDDSDDDGGEDDDEVDDDEDDDEDYRIEEPAEVGHVVEPVGRLVVEDQPPGGEVLHLHTEKFNKIQEKQTTTHKQKSSCHPVAR